MKPKANTGSEITQELLLGTWQAIGLIGDALVRSGAIRRAELLMPLAAAQALTHSLDRRHLAFGAVHGLIDSVDDGDDPEPEPRRPHPSPRPLARRFAPGASRPHRPWSHRCRSRGALRGG